MSVPYYTRLERGDLSGVSDSVLQAVAKALQLDDAERAHLFDRDFTDLVGELSTRSDEFRVRWAAHDVRFHDAVVKRLCHPVVGELDLHYNRIVLPGDDGLSVTTYTAEPGSRSDEAFRLLGSWAATGGEQTSRTTSP